VTYRIVRESGSGLRTESGANIVLESAATESLEAIGARVEEIYRMVRDLYLLHGLERATPLNVSQGARTAGEIAQTISDSDGTVTVTRL